MPDANEMLSDIIITYPKGQSKDGRFHASVRPKEDCLNRSINVIGFTEKDLQENITKCIQRHFHPMQYFHIDGHKIGSNNAENALMEYWKVCRIEDVGNRFIVSPIDKKVAVSYEQKNTFQQGMEQKQAKVIPQAPQCKMRY